MSGKPKRQVRPRSPKAGLNHPTLQQFDCVSVRYDFDLPIEAFNTRTFSKHTGLKKGDRWEAVLPTEDEQSNYHVHFKGNIETERVHLCVEYWGGAVKRTRIHPPQSSEDVMRWLGSFIKEPSSRAVAFTRFEKPDRRWRSRFNLPFKVTMSGAEVVIDGVSLILPRNEFHAMNGWLSKMESVLLVSVNAVRPIEFATFNLGAELEAMNESIKVFAEELP